MTTWAERAKAFFSQERHEHTDETDKTMLSSVLSVCAESDCEKSHGVSSVLSVCAESVCEKQGFAIHHDSSSVRLRSERVTRMLAERDPWDDRRSCAECSSYYAGQCIKRLHPVGQCDDIADVLHRCAGFVPTDDGRGGDDAER